MAPLDGSCLPAVMVSVAPAETDPASVKSAFAPEGSAPAMITIGPSALAETTWFSGSVLTGSGVVAALTAKAIRPASSPVVVSATVT